MKDILLVGVGGGLGALARYGLGLAVVRWLGTGFPWATLAINVIGCLLIGMALAGGPGPTGFLSRELRLLGVIGFLGAFTTFSTFGYETVSLLQAGKPLLAAGYVIASLVLGLGAVGLGLLALRAWT
jgi:CrcB protein